MALYVFTDTPKALLRELKEAIAEDRVVTWSYDSDGDFTHLPPQWHRRAWLRPLVEDDRLIFTILPPRGEKISRATYGVYHGRFIEMLLSHFDQKFHKITATAMPARGDNVG
jgi:hypothetical protein